MQRKHIMSKEIEIQDRWGPFGKFILVAGAGGGYVTLPYVLDDYERALGLEPRETWLLKRYLRNYWHGGDNVFPSFDEISRQANISAPTLRKLRNQLMSKGLIKNAGKKGQTNGLPDNRVKVNLSPLFNALFLCIVCDPKSKIVKRDSHADVRAAFSRYLGNDPEKYAFGKFFENVNLPLDIQNAKNFAHHFGFSLAWDVIGEMQGKESMDEFTRDKERYARELGVKKIIKDAGLEIRWGWKHAYQFLQWLVDSGLPTQDLYNMTCEYMEHPILYSEGHGRNIRNERHSFRAFREFIESGVTRWQKTNTEQLQLAAYALAE
jgi:hypothetical protein